MRRFGFLTTALLVLMLAACGGEDVPGTYVLDKEFLQESLRELAEEDSEMQDKSPAEIDRHVQQVFETLAPRWRMEIVFEPDGTYSVLRQSPGKDRLENAVTGTWSLEGTRITVTPDESIDNPSSARPETLQFVDGMITAPEKRENFPSPRFKKKQSQASLP